MEDENSTTIWAEKARAVLTKLVEQYCEEVQLDGDIVVFNDMLQSDTLEEDIVNDFMITIKDWEWVRETLKD